jgi:hypothetical protein
MRPQDGVGGCVPKPRKFSAASASTAMAKDTDACTTSVPPTLGSTCRTAMSGRLRPGGAAARTYSVRSTRSAPARVTRANAGTVASAMAAVAVTVPPPKTAASMIASSSAGKASSRSLARMSRLSTQPPAVAASSPSGTPTSRGQADRQRADQQGRAGAEHQQRQGVPAEAVGAQRVLGARAEQPGGRVDAQRVVRRPEQRQQRGGGDQADEQRTDDQARAGPAARSRRRLGPRGGGRQPSSGPVIRRSAAAGRAGCS